MTNYYNYSEQEMIDMIFFTDMESPEFAEWEKALENDERLYKTAEQVGKNFFSVKKQNLSKMILTNGFENIQIFAFGESFYFQPIGQGLPEKLPKEVKNKRFPEITLNFEKDTSSGNYKVFMVGGEYEKRTKMIIEISYKDVFAKDTFLGKETALGGHWEIQKDKVELISTIVWKLEE